MHHKITWRNGDKDVYFSTYHSAELKFEKIINFMSSVILQLYNSYRKHCRCPYLKIKQAILHDSYIERTKFFDNLYANIV